jgi:hypothetical protein
VWDRKSHLISCALYLVTITYLLCWVIANSGYHSVQRALSRLHFFRPQMVAFFMAYQKIIFVKYY